MRLIVGARGLNGLVDKGTPRGRRRGGYVHIQLPMGATV